jgi:glycosyltransferase involved in cell wall biosynthesis
MLTFIIPAYGNSPYLEQCIESLKSQSIQCPILITTSTPSIELTRIANKNEIKILINQSRSSIATDWNFSLDAVTTGLVVLAHQDDIYYQSFASEALNIFSKHSNLAIAFSDSHEIINQKVYENPKREIVKKILRRMSFLGLDVICCKWQYFRLLAIGCPIPCSSVIFNMDKIGGLRFSEQYSVNLDWDFWCRVASSGGPIGYFRGALIAHRIHDGAETQAALQDSRRYNEDKKIFSRFWPGFLVPLIHFFYRAGYSD